MKKDAFRLVLATFGPCITVQFRRLELQERGLFWFSVSVEGVLFGIASV